MVRRMIREIFLCIQFSKDLSMEFASAAAAAEVKFPTITLYKHDSL